MPLQAAQSSLNSLALCCCHAAERAEVVPARDHGCERERVESHPRVGRLSRTRCAMLFVLRHLAEVLKFVPTQTRLASSACCRCSSRALASPCITWCVFLLGPVLRTLLFHAEHGGDRFHAGRGQSRAVRCSLPAEELARPGRAAGRNGRNRNLKLILARLCAVSRVPTLLFRTFFCCLLQSSRHFCCRQLAISNPFISLWSNRVAVRLT